MSTGLEVRAVQFVPASPARVELRPERQVTRTELPQEKTVLPQAETQQKNVDQNDPSRKLRADLNTKIDKLQSEPVKKISIDSESQELVFRTVSAETGKVVSQFPDEAYLRQRAYADHVEKAKALAESQAKISDAKNVEKVA
jgi:uncharacterized FlaG/YvyC family protein